MTEDDIIAFVTSLSGVAAITASEANGAPEISWGDSFFFYDPDGELQTSRRMPFATMVTKDYDGFDTASNLNRPGVFRLNIAVGRAAFERLIGYPPAASVDQSSRWDYRAGPAASASGVCQPGLGGHSQSRRGDHRPGTISAHGGS